MYSILRHMSSLILTYSKLITTYVTISDSGTIGHRIQCPISIYDMNRFFTWHRPVASASPVGVFTPCDFSYILEKALSKCVPNCPRQIYGSIEESLRTEPAAVNSMFQTILSSDPARFFTLDRRQISGLFDVDAKSVAKGSWTFNENDKIELNIQCICVPSSHTFQISLHLVATMTSISQQLSHEAAAAQKAADALALASQATIAAEAQSAAAQTKYAAAVSRNAQQQKLVSAAKAALTVAQTALSQTSGKEVNSQQLAAVFSSKALLENQQAIADLAAADLLDASKEVTQTTAHLNATQTIAAAQSLINSAAANASLALASTLALATTITPLTQTLEDDILDPKNLSIILDTATITINRRKAALQTYTSLLCSSVETGTISLQLAESTLTSSYTQELTDIYRANLASSNAAAMSASLATTKTNSANRSLTTARNAYIYASTMNTNAAAAVTEAQTILNNRISNNAVISEIKTRRAALLDAKNTCAAATSTLNAALAKMTNATRVYEAASTISVNANMHISSVAASNRLTIKEYQESVSSFSALRLKSFNSL